MVGAFSMMEFFKILVWLLLNVGVPLLAPIALLPLLGASPSRRVQRLLFFVHADKKIG